MITTENVVSSDYLVINEYEKKKQLGFSLLHLNISSSSAYLTELETLLSQVDTKFGIICISKNRISK